MSLTRNTERGARSFKAERLNYGSLLFTGLTGMATLLILVLLMVAAILRVVDIRKEL